MSTVIPQVVTTEPRDKRRSAPRHADDGMESVAREVAYVIAAVKDGRLDTRAELNGSTGLSREILQGLNGMLDGLVRPIRVTVDLVTRIGCGDMPPRITEAYVGEFDAIKQGLNNAIDSINAVVADAEMLSEAALEGRIGTRADAARHQGKFRAIVKGVNETLDTVVGFLDNMPAPAMAVNRDFEILYMNKIGASLGNTTGAQLAGARTHCYDFFRTGDCKTAKCACAQAMQTNGTASSETEARPGTHRLDISYAGTPIRDRSGNVIGAFEVVSDQTAITQATRTSQKVAAFQSIEVDRLNRNLAKIAEGDLEVELAVADADADTKETREKFVTIAAGLSKSVAAVKALVADADVLVKAAVDGKLAMRADASMHRGDFRKIIDGVNRTLDAVVGPLNVAAEYVDRISKGDIPPKITDMYNGDFNEIKNNLNSCIENISALVADASMLSRAAVEGRIGTRADAARHQGDYRKIVDGVNSTLDELAIPLTAIVQNVQALGSAAEELGGISEQMAGNAEETATQVNVVTAATEQVSKNVMVVATSSEEMLASIREIAKSANDAAKMAKGAVLTVNATNTTVKKLGESSLEIGKVIKVITSIAQQTNLLALNATIEAARAGEAGKGFAVVANEVKELAKETAKATEDISQKIEAIQSDTKGAVQAIGEIGGIIGQIDDISNTIASAVEEQTATTNEMGRNLSEAAKGTNEVARNISGVSQAAESTAHGAAETQKSARSLSEMAVQLQTVTSKFKV